LATKTFAKKLTGMFGSSGLILQAGRFKSSLNKEKLTITAYKASFMLFAHSTVRAIH
jgi:hypothetical protein